jgi:hypothetical protein
MFHSGSQTTSKSRPSLPRLLGPRNPSYTAEEVRERLQVDRFDSDASDARTAAVHAAAALTAVWTSLLSDRMAFYLGRSADRLPTVVFWHRQGLSANEIGRRISPFGTAWDADRALTAAARLIAEALNQGAIAELAL